MTRIKKIKKVLISDVWFHIFASTSVLLIIISFFIPPTGVIDGSVFAGVGELFGFAALWEAHVAIKRGMDAKITHNNTIVELNNPDEINNEEAE